MSKESGAVRIPEPRPTTISPDRPDIHLNLEHIKKIPPPRVIDLIKELDPKVIEWLLEKWQLDPSLKHPFFGPTV